MISKNYFFALFFLSFNGLIAFSQPKFKSNAADHFRAIDINDSIVGPYDVSTGYGKELEFKLDHTIKEENSIWFNLQC